MTYDIKTKHFNEKNCTIAKGKYPNGRAALQILCSNGEPFMTATTNLVDMNCEEGYAYIKDYSGNQGVFKCLWSLGVIAPEPSDRWVTDGFGTVFPYVKILI